MPIISLNYVNMKFKWMLHVSMLQFMKKTLYTYINIYIYISNWSICSFFPDHLSFCISPNTELHCPRPLVCNLPPTDVQEHSQEGSQEYCCHLGCVVHHHDSSGYCDGVQQPAAWTNKQNQPVHSVWWTLRRLVFTKSP